MTLAAHVAAEPQPVGDATLVERETGAPGQASIHVWDLYTDDGRYPKADTELAYQEATTINADTGIPLGFAGGPAGKVTVTITYVVTRSSWPTSPPASSDPPHRPAIPGQPAPWPGIAGRSGTWRRYCGAVGVAAGASAVPAADESEPHSGGASARAFPDAIGRSAHKAKPDSRSGSIPAIVPRRSRGVLPRRSCALLISVSSSARRGASESPSAHAPAARAGIPAHPARA
jgi:hypothetical protein